jgi:hypothetical protein
MLYQQNPTNFEFHKKTQKIVSQHCPKWLKIVYFCPKSPLFELFDLNGMSSIGDFGRFFETAREASQTKKYKLLIKHHK